MPKPLDQSVRRRARSQSAAKRDEQILKVAVSLTAKDGWDALNFNVLAESTGLSRTPLYSRFGDKLGLALAMWEHCQTEFVSQLTMFTNALLSSDAEKATGAAKKFIVPNAEMITIGELMMASIFDAALNRRVQKTFRRLTADVPVGKVESAQVFYSWLCAIGFLMAHKRGRVNSMKFDTVIAEILHAFERPAKPIRIPMPRRPVTVNGSVAESEDETTLLLLHAVLEEVAQRGYAAADVRSIARRVQLTEGFIYSRYASKLEMFLTATRMRLRQSFEQNIALAQDIATKHSFGVAQASIMIEAMTPENANLRAIRIEQLRLGWHNQQMKAIADETEAAVVAGNRSYVPAGTTPTELGEIHWAFGMGLAVSLLPEIVPPIATQHFEVVTIPLYDN